ncbi:MAG: hypothetical protein AB1649_28400, partial [Chloroflexota bacterium]
LEGISGVAIGVIFTWFVLSLATVQIQEWIASLLHWRAKNLQNAIRGMFCSENLTELFYDHPIIRGLSLRGKDRDTKPSYIPNNQFSTVLLNILQNLDSEHAILIYGLYGLPAALDQIKPRKRRKQAREDLNRIFEIARLTASARENKQLDDLILVTLEKEIVELGERYVEIKEATQALIEDARANKLKLDAALKLTPDVQDTPARSKSILSGALALGALDPELKIALNALLLGAEDPDQTADEFLKRIRLNIETWFDDSMDRISGWYKRLAQFSTFTIGLICAIVFNIDSIHLTAQLWREPILREAISDNASLVLSQYAESDGSLNVEAISFLQLLQDRFLELPIGWNFYSVYPTPSQACSFSPTEGEVFGFSSRTGCIRPFGAQDTTNGWLWLFYKTIGLLITGLASAQGSSFWFDMLSKLVNIRSAGRKPV